MLLILVWNGGCCSWLNVCVSCLCVGFLESKLGCVSFVSNVVVLINVFFVVFCMFGLIFLIKMVSMNQVVIVISKK